MSLRNLTRWVIGIVSLSATLMFLTACEGAEARKASHMEKGRDHYDRGVFDKASLEFRNVLQIDPESAEAWYLLGRIDERAGEYTKAFRNYSRAVELDPTMVDARVHKAQFLIAAKDLDAAQAEIDAALAQAPRHADALVAHGTLNLLRGATEEAEADARAALSVDSDHVDATALLAAVQVERNASEDAIETLRSAIEKHPDEAALRLSLVRVYESQGDTGGQLKVLQGLAERYPDVFTYHVELANYFLRLKRLTDAESALRGGLAGNPEDLIRQRALIEFIATTKGPDAARTELAGMLERQPDAMPLRFMEAELLRLKGDDGAAETAYRAIIERTEGSGPDAVRARSALATMLIAAERNEEAAALVDAVLKESNREAVALQARAELALRRNDPEQAVGDLQVVLRDDPELLSALRMLGRAHAMRGDLALADDAFNKAIALAPNDPQAYLLLAESRRSTGDNDGAILILERLLQEVPDNSQVQQVIAQIRLSQQDWDALEQMAARIKANSPEDPQGFYLEGLVLQRKGLHAEAVASLDQALELRPGAVDLLVAVARSRLALGAPEEAERRIRQALTSDPDNPVALNLLGDIYAASGAPEKAMTTFEEAIRANPQSPQAYQRLAELELARGDSMAARQTLENGVAATNRNGFLLLRLAVHLDRVGESEAAIVAYDEVLANYPDTPIATNNLAMLLARRVGDQAAQSRALELAESLQERQVPEFLDTLGWVHHLRGEYGTGLPYLEQAVADKPDDPELRFHLGMNYVKLGRIEEAREHLAMAASSEKFVHRAEAQEALEALGDSG